MAELRFKFFGPPFFELNGAPIRIGRRKAAALAAYLTVTGKSHSRERLADMFWPEYDRERAKSSLRRTLSVMTKALGKFWLVIDRDSIGFKPHEYLWVDVIRFRKLMTLSPLEPEYAAALEEAAGLHESSFLAGFILEDAPDFDEWQFEQAEELGREAILGAERLARWYTDRGEFHRAIHHARRRVELDPLNEAAHRQLIQHYNQAGQKGFALRQYEKCKDILQRELGVTPEESTSELAANIRTERLAPEQQFYLPLTNLPAQSNLFVGRKQDLKTLVNRVSNPGVRLMTLTGPGGIGKTRLALEAATVMEAAPDLTEQFPQGVFFLSLGDLTSLDAVVTALLRIFGLSLDEKSQPLAQLLEFIGPRKFLLVLDNLEHLPESAMLASKMLSQAPGLKILATSRTRLLLKGEHVFPLSGLQYPGLLLAEKDATDAIKSEEIYDAAALFLSAARMVRPDMEVNEVNLRGIARICELTQGMPLALILAAGWVEIFPPEKIADEIRESLDFLTAEYQDLPSCHQSMRAVFDSSWDRLPDNEKDFFMKLSVLRDGFTLDAAAAVIGVERNFAASAGASLVRKSMLKADPETGRFEIHPLLRQYVREKLADAGLVEEMEAAHGNYYLNLATENEKRLISEGMLACRKEMDADFANIRQAWLWAVDRGDLAGLARAAEGLYVYFDMHTLYHEGEALFRPAKELLMRVWRADMDPQAGIILLCWFDMQAQGVSPQDRPISTVEEFRETAAAARGLLKMAVKRGDSQARAFALLLLGAIARGQEQYQRAIRFFRLSIEENPGIENSYWVAMRIGLCRRAMGQIDLAIKRFKQSHEIGRRLGDNIKQAWSLGNIGSAELCLGNLETAESNLRSAEASFSRINAPMGLVLSWEELALIAFLRGDFSLAVSLTDQALEIATAHGFDLSRYQRARALKGLALVAAGDADRGEPCLEKAAETGLSCFTANLGLTFTACLKGDRFAAERRLESAAERSSSVHKPQLKSLLLLASAAAAAQAGEDEKACELLSLALKHPSCPKGLFDVWELPRILVVELKSRMTPGQFKVAWEKGKQRGAPNAEPHL